MKTNISYKNIFIYAIVLGFILYSCHVYADEKLPDGRVAVDSDKYIRLINLAKQAKQKLPEIEKLSGQQKEEILILKEELKLRKQNEKFDRSIMDNYEKSIKILEQHLEYTDKRINLYREEVKQLETKGTKNRLEKVGTVASDTATGCAMGLLFGGVGVGPGCAIGAMSGVVKSFFFDLL